MNQSLYQTIVIEKSHRTLRKQVPDVAEEYAALDLPPRERQTHRFELLCRLEEPTFLAGEQIAFIRTCGKLPPIYTPREAEARLQKKQKEFIFGSGVFTNLTVDYAKILKTGFLPLKEGADPHSCRVLDALMALAERYRLAAAEQGLNEIADTLAQVPARGARSFREALQLVRIVNFGLWLEGNTHNTLGRFDQYMMPYLQKDLDEGRLDREAALELVEEFFLSLNRDNDLYPGVQQGDNGQSLMLAGRTKEGHYGFNLLSELCLLASKELKIIDPKINIRVDRNTPEEVFTLCSELTKAGLGFPQYSNDDIVIPALIRWGYDPEDAVDYTVAACWEFIIPAVACDVPNISALSLPQVVDLALDQLPGCKTMEEFLAVVRQELHRLCDNKTQINLKSFIDSPFLERLMDWKDGTPKYQNFGMHGVGLANAADSLAAIDAHVFRGALSPKRLVDGVRSNFEKDPELLHLLRYESPKLGCDEPLADHYLCYLTDIFAEDLEARTNCLGGCWRPGTGSAMYYLRMPREIGASPDGRRAGEPLSANYSVSLFARPEGPFSVLRSMTAPDLKRICNGGPLTLEFHQSLFRHPDSCKKLGQFVKKFIEMGGHQLQLNAVNSETLKDAQQHPEQYPQLIVRIWGWSAYFTELDRSFRDHVIARQEYSL